MSTHLRVADDRDADGLWPAVHASHLFGTREEFDAYRTSAPWRVLASGGGEGAILERWREHLDILAIKGMWGAPRQLPSMLRDVDSIATRQGFNRLLSPLVPDDVARLYQEAGMHVHQRLVTLRAASNDVDQRLPEPGSGVKIRLSVPEDMPEILALDSACFNSFWRYEPRRIAERLISGRVTVAESDQGIIGYTHATIDRGSGTIGRLAVGPGSRRGGVGTAMLKDAMQFLVRAGVSSVSLCTQEENAASRALYASLGLKELPGRLVFLMTGEEFPCS